jgi:hypothetical protein
VPQTLLCLNLRFSFVLLGVSICIRGAIGPALYSMGWVSLFGGFAIGMLDLVFGQNMLIGIMHSFLLD